MTTTKLEFEVKVKVIYVDIDDTICHYPGGKQKLDYSKAVPYPIRIDKINMLHEQGHQIVYWTARGTITGRDWLSVTKQQLEQWGCKYTELKMGKPFYDLFIDDKNMSSEQYFSKND